MVHNGMPACIMTSNCPSEFERWEIFWWTRSPSGHGIRCNQLSNSSPLWFSAEQRSAHGVETDKDVVMHIGAFSCDDVQ